MLWANRDNVSVVFIALTLYGGAVAGAQETRAEQASQQRAEKAARLEPYARPRLESILLDVDEKQLVPRIFDAPRGLFARVGGLVEQAGVAAGPALRLSNPDISFTVSTVFSTKAYWLAEATLDAPRLANGRVFARVSGRRRSLPQEHFYGLGPSATALSRTSFSLRDSSVNAEIGGRLTRWLSIASGAGYLAPRVGPGSDQTSPSIDGVFADSTAPGLRQQPDFGHVETRATIDYATPAENPYSGGRYSLAYHKYDDLASNTFAFHRWDVDLQQYVPIIEGFRMIALRAFASLSDPEPGQEVPFYLQRTLGGAYSLRGLDPYRLRDRNIVLLQAEYRWAINAFASGALFVDTGTVGHERTNLNLRHMKRDYGMGIRLGAPRGGVALRADVAFSSEGKHLILRFEDVF